MRYKIRAPDDVTFDALHKELEASKELLLASKRRRVLSTGELSEATRQAVRDRGAEILEDRQYEPG